MNGNLVPLADICQMDRQQVRPDDAEVLNLPFVSVEHVIAGSGEIDFDLNSRVGSQKSAAFRFDARHVLYGKLGPYLNKVATPDFAGRCSTELIPLLPRDGVERQFLAYLLRRQDTVDFAVASVTGSRMPRTNMKVLMSMHVPLPPIEEQRQTVAILNRAARIAQLRKRAQKRLQEFIPALFVKIFGDPTTNPMGWDSRQFNALVHDQTRTVTKIKKKHYLRTGTTPIVDQGKTIIAGFSNYAEGRYRGQLPAIVFGDHTRRFKLVHFPFLLGADGAKVLLPIHSNLDTVFLFGQLKCLTIDAAGYSRHYKFLKSMNLILPPIQQQLRFREFLQRTEAIIAHVDCATKIGAPLTETLMSCLLQKTMPPTPRQ